MTVHVALFCACSGKVDLDLSHEDDAQIIREWFKGQHPEGQGPHRMVAGPVDGMLEKFCQVAENRK